MSATVEQSRGVLYAVPCARAERIPAMDCTTEEKSTIAGPAIEVPGSGLTGGTMDCLSVVSRMLIVGVQRVVVCCDGICDGMRHPRTCCKTGGEGVEGRAPVGAYDVFGRPKLFHIAFGMICRPLVKINPRRIPPTLGFLLQKKERGAA